jgi:hypothetical protein
MSKRFLVSLAALLTVMGALAAPVLAQPAHDSRPPLPAPPPPPPPPQTPPVPVTPPADATPSAVIVASDADASVTLKSGAVERTVAVKKGDNRIELPRGHFVAQVDPAKARVQPTEGDLAEPGQEVRLVLTTQGRVMIALPGEDGRVEVDGKALAAKDGKASADLPAGPHSIIVRQPGHFGAKGSVDVAPGRTVDVAARLEKFEGGGNQNLAWAGILGGGALIVAAIAVDAFSKYDEIGGDTTRWTLLGLGTVGFVAGTILLKSSIDANASPPVKDASFDVKVAGVRGGAVAQVGARF